MIKILKESLWKQFGASIDMLKNAITLWPEESWDTNTSFFYNAYHCLVFLDYYLTIPAEKFSSPLPFTIKEAAEIPENAIDDLVPNRIYSKNELLDYLEQSREKCRRVIDDLTNAKLAERWIEVDDDRNYAVLELLLYNMRHVQHHAAQLNMLLRREIKDAPRWVSRAKDEVTIKTTESARAFKVKAILSNLRKIRKRKNYSQANMAVKLKLSQAGYGAIEQGSIEVTVARLIKIAEILEVDLIDLVKPDKD